MSFSRQKSLKPESVSSLERSQKNQRRTMERRRRKKTNFKLPHFYLPFSLFSFFKDGWTCFFTQQGPSANCRFQYHFHSSPLKAIVGFHFSCTAPSFSLIFTLSSFCCLNFLKMDYQNKTQIPSDILVSSFLPLYFHGVLL